MYIMNTPKRSVSFITFFLFPFTIASIDNCLTSKCRVTSPFRTPDQPANCGLPGFDLSCDYPYKKPLLPFPTPGHNFSVDSIDYYLKLVKLSDLQGCLQKKLLGFDPSGTRFGFRHPAYFPLYKCSRSVTHLPSYFQGLEIGCLSGSDYSVLWDKYGALSAYYGCEFIGDAMGPKDWTNYAFLFSTAKSVYMSWDLPAACQRCGYGGCQRDPYDPRRVTCSASLPTPPNQFQSASSIDNCSTSKCRVTSPFRTPDQPATCGLPGFDLSCDFPYDTPILSFPSPGHNFSVDSINYYSKVITVSDPEGCLQKKLLGFDPSGTPFGFRYQAAYYFPIYNCSRSINLPNYYQDLEIGCLSGSNYSVFWDKYYLASSNYYSRCDFVGEALGPGDWAVYTSVFSSAVSVDLSWKLPAGCQRCVYGGCQRHPNYATGVTCSASPPAPPSKDITKIVLPIIATPVLVLLALVCVCISCKARSSTPHATLRDTFPSNNINITSQTTSHLNPNSQSSVLPIGLEQHTLDAYPIMMVGGSGRILLNMEDKTCPICLSDYEPRDTLKTLPECLHRFHAECIDEWLRAKALCPVCRTPPPRPRPSS